MGISAHGRSSARRPGSCRATRGVPRAGRVPPTRSTPTPTPTRTIRIRPPAPSRKQPPQAVRAHRAQQTRRASSQLSPAPPHEQHTAHSQQPGCTFYCYFCYCCYCCCLTMLSFSLLHLLSPTPYTPPPAPVSSLSSHVTLALPLSSSSPRSLTPSSVGLSCLSDVNWTPAVPPCLPCDESSSCLCISSLTSDQLTSTCFGSSAPPSPVSDSIFLIPPPPLLCRPWPSSRSLSSLLLCPPSFGDPVLSYASTLEHISSGPARPRTLLRQQSLQQPLIRPPGPGLSHPPTTSQSLGELNTASGQAGLAGGAGKGEAGSSGGEGGGTRGGPRGARGSPAGAGASRYRGGAAGGRSRATPGSWDYMMDQIRKRGLDVKSFL